MAIEVHDVIPTAAIILGRNHDNIIVIYRSGNLDIARANRLHRNTLCQHLKPIKLAKKMVVMYRDLVSRRRYKKHLCRTCWR